MEDLKISYTYPRLPDHFSEANHLGKAPQGTSKEVYKRLGFTRSGATDVTIWKVGEEEYWTKVSEASHLSSLPSHLKNIRLEYQEGMWGPTLGHSSRPTHPTSGYDGYELTIYGDLIL